MTELLAKAGYDMIGVDNSEDMLEIAMDKRGRSGLDILYLLQDMREFELYGTVKAAVSICDSMNYILEKEDLLQVFKLVNNYLDPSGIFIFDMNTEYKFREVLGQRAFGSAEEAAAYIWENDYDEEEKINEYYVSFFIEQENGLYERVEEYHYERAYTTEEVAQALQAAGMELLEVTDGYSFAKPHEKSERLLFAARLK